MIDNYNKIQESIFPIISAKTGITDPSLLSVAELSMLGLDLADIVDIILQIERLYGVVIPDEVPLHTANDFVQYLSSRQAS